MKNVHVLKITIYFFVQVPFYMTAHNEPTIYLNFENVPIEKLDADVIPSKLDEIFNKLMTDDSYFDLERLRTFVERNKLNMLSSLDNCPHEALATIIIGDFLYGKSLSDVSKFIYFLRFDLYS